MSHCKYLVVNITIFSLYISLPSHCKCHHSLTVCPLIVKSFWLCSVVTLNFYNYLSSYLCFMLLPGLRVFNHTLPDWCVGDSYSCYLFLPFFVGCCLSVLLPGWSCISPLSSTGILLGLLIGRGVTAGQNILWSTPFPTQESTCGVTSREFPWTLSGAQEACFTLHPIWRCCKARLRYANRHTDQPMHPRCQLVWCLLTTQSFDTSREVDSWWSEHHV